MGLYIGNQRVGNLGETFTPREIQSVNGKFSVQGNITVYGSDIQVSESDSRTIENALSSGGMSVLTNDLTFQTQVGGIQAGTTFSKGTSLETVLIAMANPSVVETNLVDKTGNTLLDSNGNILFCKEA